MALKIFVNLPVKDLNRSIEFFTKLGYTFNPQFTDENATCMILSEEIYVMLLVEPMFKGFIGDKTICDASKSTEALLSLSLESRAAVDELIQNVVAAGGTARNKVDHGFMYQWGYEDLDGHIWEPFYMDPSFVK